MAADLTVNPKLLNSSESEWPWDDPTYVAGTAAGNWKRGSSPSPYTVEINYFKDEHIDDGSNWCLWIFSWYQHSLMDEANERAIRDRFAKLFAEGKDVRDYGPLRTSVLGYLVRVYQERGGVPINKLTSAFELMCKTRRQLQQYAVLNDFNYSEMVYDATVRNIEQGLRGHKLWEYCYWAPEPEDGNNPGQHLHRCAEALWKWFWDNDQQAIEGDDDGGYPSDDQLAKAIFALGWTNHLRVAIERDTEWWNRTTHQGDLRELAMKIDDWLKQFRPDTWEILMKGHAPKDKEDEDVRQAFAYSGLLLEEFLEPEEELYWQRQRWAAAQEREGMRQAGMFTDHQLINASPPVGR